MVCGAGRPGVWGAWSPRGCEALRVGEGWRGPVLVLRPHVTVFALIMDAVLRDEEVSWAFRRSGLQSWWFPLVFAGHLGTHVSHSWSHLLRRGIKYLSNLEIVFLAELTLETEIKLVVRCQATGGDWTGQCVLHSVLYLVKFHIYCIPHYFINFNICTSYYQTWPSFKAQRHSSLIRSDRLSTFSQPLRGSLEQRALFPWKCFELGYFYWSIKVILQILGYYLSTFGRIQ